MNSIVETETFKNRNGELLFVITHVPNQVEQKDAVILLLSPGVKMRVAPHRLYNKMADEFVNQGYVVARFDFSGLGDSEGEIEEDLLADFYNTVQFGRYVNDTVDAMDWAERKYKKNRFILAGLCGGAITGLLAGQVDERVEALLSLNIPVILDGSNQDKTKYLTEGQLDRLKKNYLKRLFDLKSWLRLLTFKSDYKLLFKSLIRKNKKRDSEKQQDNAVDSNVNPLFEPAFMDWIDRSKKMLLIFSGSDRLTWEYNEKFATPNKDKLDGINGGFEVHVVDEANHIFSYKSWYEEMMKLSLQWLKNDYKLG
ncbi:MAG: alpha/beta hydrolase [Candidatus Thiodiazotropha sp.]